MNCILYVPAVLFFRSLGSIHTDKMPKVGCVMFTRNSTKLLQR